MPVKQTPLMLQYDRIKAKYPNYIVLIRIGDFYEAFDGDAEIFAETCDLVLSSRLGEGGYTDNRGLPRRWMAGVPYHACESYVKELVQAGYKVAVAEQVGEAVNGIVPREVTRKEG